jgi:hypothetical protein
MSNYRSISLLTSFSKVFEKVIYKRLHYHIKSNNTLAKEQYGFRNNSSTEIASYNPINNILKALNNKMWAGGIFCDLTKAFDYVNHNSLLSRLEFYGITGRANNLIKSYLNDRYQRVLIKNIYSKNCFSEWEKVKQGVPQGSILGPLFFLLYINDLPGIINDISKPTLFADDNNIIITESNLRNFKDKINTGLFIMYSGITKIYYRKTAGHIFTKPIQIERTTQKFFPSKFSFIVVHTFAAISKEYRCTHVDACMART